MPSANRRVMTSDDSRDSSPAGSWGFLTNHANVLISIAGDPGLRLRDIAAEVGVTERAAHRIVSELVEEGYLVRHREGRRNRYEVVEEQSLRHPLVEERQVGELLKILTRPGASSRQGTKST